MVGKKKLKLKTWILNSKLNVCLFDLFLLNPLSTVQPEWTRVVTVQMILYEKGWIPTPTENKMFFFILGAIGSVELRRRDAGHPFSDQNKIFRNCWDTFAVIVSRVHHVTAPAEWNQHSGYKSEMGHLYHSQYAWISWHIGIKYTQRLPEDWCFFGFCRICILWFLPDLY